MKLISPELSADLSGAYRTNHLICPPLRVKPNGQIKSALISPLKIPNPLSTPLRPAGGATGEVSSLRGWQQIQFKGSRCSGETR